MEMREFAVKVRNAVRKELGAEYRVEIKEIRKNNGVVLQGLLILTPGQSVTPTIYLNTFLDIYESGVSFAEVIRKLIAIYRKDTPKTEVDMNFFRSFGRVKDRICYRLVGTRGNEDLLSKVPHIEFLDLALCFYYAYQSEALGEGTILIHDSHVEMWETSTAELLGLAKENTPRLFPWTCCSLNDVLQEMTEEGAYAREGIVRNVPMSVLSNQKKLHGAVCMIYPGVLEELALRMKGNFFILPSSVHEMILLADTGIGETENLKKMVMEINSTQVAPEEILSDSLYYYDSAERKVKIIF